MQQEQNNKKPYFIHKAKIVKAFQPSMETFFTWKNPPDIALDVLVDGGKDFLPTIRITGKYRKNSEGKVTGGGTTWKVKAFFNALEVNGTNNLTSEISPSLLEKVKDREIFYIRYPYKGDEYGNIKYLNYDRIAISEAMVEAMFLKDLASGYVKIYEPQIQEPREEPNIGEETELPW